MWPKSALNILSGQKLEVSVIKVALNEVTDALLNTWQELTALHAQCDASISELPKHRRPKNVKLRIEAAMAKRQELFDGSRGSVPKQARPHTQTRKRPTCADTR